MTGKNMHRTTSPLASYRGPSDLPLLGEIDQRSKPALAFRAANLDFCEDLGGADRLSRAQIEIIRRCAAMAVIAARFDETLCNGGELSDEQVNSYIAISNAQSRSLCRLGLRRVSRDITPTLAQLRSGEVA